MASRLDGDRKDVLELGVRELHQLVVDVQVWRRSKQGCQARSARSLGKGDLTVVVAKIGELVLLYAAVVVDRTYDLDKLAAGEARFEKG